MQGFENGGNRIFLVNKNKKNAWELVDENGYLSLWDASAFEVYTILGIPECNKFNLPKEIRRSVLGRRVNFYFGFDEFKNGVTYVTWTIQPDGQFYADSGGFGITNDQEINLYAFIDKDANILIPFQPMDEMLLALYRKQAERIVRHPNEERYVCLVPELTIPFSDNLTLSEHKETLIRIIYSTMLRFGIQAQNAHLHPEYNRHLSIVSAINSNETKRFEYVLQGSLVEGTKDTYDIFSILSPYGMDEYPQGCGGHVGQFKLSEIPVAMQSLDNAKLMLYDILNSYELLISGQIPCV